MIKKKNIISVVRMILLFIIGVIVLSPIILAIITSLKSNQEFIINPIGLPKNLTFDNFKQVFFKGQILLSYMNSLIITISSLIFLVFSGSLAAYALTKMRLKRSNLYTAAFLVPIVFSINIVVLPVFMIFKWLHLLNNYFGAIIIYTATCLPITIFILTKFLKSVPYELSEAAFIDGATHFQVYYKIILPLIKTPMSTIIIINGLYIWNDFFVPLMFFTERKIPTITLSLFLFQHTFYTEWPPVSAGIIYLAFPLIVLYAFLQRFVIKGIAEGAVKG